MARGQAQSRGACAGCGGRSERLELEHTDVKALTDVSGTDASFAQACAAVWICTRGSLRFVYSTCVCMWLWLCSVFVSLCGDDLLCVWAYMFGLCKFHSFMLWHYVAY